MRATRFKVDLELISYSVSVLASVISSLTTSNQILAIPVNGRLGNALFEIASGVGIAEHYKVINLKLDPFK